jgi:transcriptional regulator with XRE-family HTH domain
MMVYGVLAVTETMWNGKGGATMRPGTGVLTLRQARFLRALTQQELAERAGLNAVHVSRIESGAVAPHPATRRALAAALDIAVERIVWPGSDLAVGAITRGRQVLTK